MVVWTLNKSSREPNFTNSSRARLPSTRCLVLATPDKTRPRLHTSLLFYVLRDIWASTELTQHFCIFYLPRESSASGEQSLTGVFASFFGKSATKVAPTPTSVMQPPDSRKVCCGACCRQYHHLPSAVTSCAWPEADLATSESALHCPYNPIHPCKLNLGVFIQEKVYLYCQV